MSRYDVNGDCLVNKEDADTWDEWYNQNGGEGGIPCPSGSPCGKYEFNNDGFIDATDRGCLCAVCDCTGSGWRCFVPGCQPS